MGSDDVGGVIGAVLLMGLVLVVVVAAFIIVLALGSLIGTCVGLVNYCKSFQANVRLERPGA